MPITFAAGSNAGFPATTASNLPIYAGDWDDDGDTDFFFIAAAGGAIQYARNDGAGVFTTLSFANSPFAGTSLFVGGLIAVLSFGDFDGDGDTDIFANGSGAYLRNDGGHFADQFVGSLSRRVIGDYDGDGDLDVLWQGATWQYARNDGLTFTPLSQAASPFAGLTLPNNAQPNYFSGDFDGDGDVDLWAAGSFAVGVLFTNNGAGTFTSAASTNFPTSSFGNYLVADFDSDGDTDIIAAGGGTAHFWRSNGDGTFTELTGGASPISGLPVSATNPVFTQVLDYDGDGDVDIFAPGLNGTSQVWLASGAPPRVAATNTADNSAHGATANITVTFSEAVTLGSGMVRIVRVSDGAVMETIAVGSAQVTGSGTSWTIDPSVALVGGVAYEVRFDRHAFVDSDGSILPALHTFNSFTFTPTSVTAVPGTGGPDTLSGTPGDDAMSGGGGDDRLAGGGGDDTLDGGPGTDTADFSAAHGPVDARLNNGTAQDGDGGHDTLVSIENLNGSAFDDILIGSSADNLLIGGLGHDVLAGLDGNDTLIGGAGDPNELIGGNGDDDYYVSANDTVVELPGQGYDRIFTTFNSYSLIANVEALIFTGTGDFSGTGNAAANSLYGGSGNDTLYGLGGDDVLFGGAGNDALWGGTGSNQLVGGAGDDDYYVEGVDAVIENAGEGHDRVLTGLSSYTLGANVEDLAALGSTAFTGTGNALDNVIIGGAGNDTLSGGGAGHDTLIGGAGDDILIGGADASALLGGVGDDRYYVGSTGDSVIENPGGGTDTVIATIAAWSLGANVENLTHTGASAFTGVGNALNNRLVGGTGDDVLTGGGGDDLAIGGAGTDVWVLSGVQANYTIVNLGGGQYRVTDSVAGRDGIDTLNTMETLRFSDGSTLSLSTVAAPAEPDLTDKHAHDALVSPAGDFALTAPFDDLSVPQRPGDWFLLHG